MANVVLDWGDGAPVEVPALWLRDNCPCEECRVASTNERRKLIGTDSHDIQPLGVAVIDGAVHIQWSDHVTVVTRPWFDELDRHRYRSPRPPQFWSADLDMPTFDHDEVWTDGPTGHRVAIDMIERFAEFGVVRVCNVPVEPGRCERFISRWVPVREVAFGRVHDVWADPGGYNIAHTAETLPPHNDMASCASPPSGQIIHMLVNESAGGDSTLVDGWAVASQLTVDDIDVLSSVWVPFRQFDTEVETWAMAPLIRTDEWGNIVHLRFSNQLMQSLDPHHPRIEDFYRAYHRLSGLLLAPENTARFRLDAGDMILMHNHRVLHGRAEFHPGTGARHLQDVYFEFEDLVNHTRVLRDRLE